MDLEKIQKLLDMAKKKQVTEFSLETPELSVSFSFLSNQPRAVTSTTYENPANLISHTLPESSQVVTPATLAKNKSATASSPVITGNDHIVRAPFVGTFYVTPSPTDPAYVKLGDRVKKGQKICILEAMKIMNEIESDVDGEIVEIFLENESFVEYGQPLFRIK